MTKRPDAKCPPRHLWSRVEWCANGVEMLGSPIAYAASYKTIDEWLDACEAFVSEWEKAA